MGQSSNRILACSLVALAAISLTACPQKSPEVQVLEARSKYSLEPTGFLVQETETEKAAAGEENPAAVVAEEISVAASAEAASADAAATAEEAAGEEMLDEEMAAPAGPRSVTVMFDLLVRFNATGDALPGITVEIVHKDPFQKEKGRHLTWAETPGLRKGEERQVPVRLEVDNYEDGDEFSVEWNDFVPPEKRGDYREFAEAAP